MTLRGIRQRLTDQRGPMSDRALLQAIINANQREITELDLSGRGLTALPPEIGRLTNLQHLNLNGNELVSLPPEIGRLTNLAELEVNRNQLTSLPPGIGRLTNLQQLSLHGNRLINLSPEIGQLIHLQDLNLGRNQLESLPPEIGRLINLLRLDIDENRLPVVPSEIFRLINLQQLNLEGNRLVTLPPETGRLTNLQSLSLWGNQITSLTPEIGRLINLSNIDVGRNQLTSLPPEIGWLISLQRLDLDENQLTSLPPEIGYLTNLQQLSLARNQIKSLPSEVGLLAHLKIILLGRNPLKEPPPGVVAQGTEAILSYLRAQAVGEERRWMSKLLLVGEGGVGKTQLLRVLRGDEFVESSPTTRGIEISNVASPQRMDDITAVGPLELEHPMDPGVTMRLNSWDFGGQDVYHATHQFFLTEQSLYLVVRNARYGWEQSNLYYWLDTIQARAPYCPVLIVSTHVDERPAHIPLQDLQRRYTQVVGHWEVSSKTGDGIDGLREAIREEAAKLPLMGERWPVDWLEAADAVRALPEKHVTARRLQEVMSGEGVSGEDAAYLAQWLHNLGELLFYQGEEELKDTVVLDPQWVTEYIYTVLDSEDLEEPLGIFRRSLMERIWGDLDSGLQDHFLRLMERFDLSYRTLRQPDISIVVERLSQDPPADLKATWDEPRTGPSPTNEISMRFDLNTTIPAGVPTWFIARQHRFTTRNHWLYGALFADDQNQPKHLALVRSYPHERYLELAVRGPYPHNFFSLLRDGLELTLARFPGLRDTIQRTVPCPGHGGKDCPFRFDYRNLERALERDPPAQEIQCQTSLELVSVSGLMHGLHWGTQGDVIGRLDQLEGNLKAEIVGGRDAVLDELKDVRTLVQRQFVIEQSKIESRCPRVFALTPATGNRWLRNLIGQKVVLHLYCEQPGEWHPTEGGTYDVPQPPEWLATVGPYLGRLVSVLKYAAPVAAAAANVVTPGAGQIIANCRPSAIMGHIGG